MNSKKYQIFISSTYEDLIEHRLKVRDTVLSMMHFPVGMELFGAAGEKQWEIIKETIDTSDYYVLIIGNRYGSIVEGDKDGENGDSAEISFTEKEFNYASSIGIPVLAFLSDESVRVDPAKIETDEKRGKLKKFREKVQSGRTVDFWSSQDDLAGKVSTALYKQFSRTPRPGWIRGDSLDLAASINTLVDLNGKLKELEEENRELRGNAVKRSPILNVSLLCVETLEEAEDKYKGWHNSDNRDPDKPKYEMVCREGGTAGGGTYARVEDMELVIHMQSIPRSGHLGNTDELTMDDVPEYLREYVSEKQIREYNDGLPDKGEVEAYNRKMHHYKSIKENGVVLGIVISNDGNEKATDIHVDFSFPDSFIVMEKSAAIDIAVAQAPQMPENPIEKADEIYQRKKAGRFDIALSNYVSGIGAAISVLPFSSRVAASLHDSLSCLDRGRSVLAGEHGVRVWKDSLMHTYHCAGGEFCIAPMVEGEFVVGISAICEELGEPIESEFRIKVVDEGFSEYR